MIYYLALFGLFVLFALGAFFMARSFALLLEAWIVEETRDFSHQHCADLEQLEKRQKEGKR
jgi:hypothetical protein